MRHKPKSATQRAKVEDEALPVGGAPPVDIPAFDKIQPRAIPEQTEAQQLPSQHQRPARSPEEIQADLKKATELFSQGQVTAPQNTPAQAQGLPDAAPGASPVAPPPSPVTPDPAPQAQTTIPANSPQQPPAPPAPEPELDEPGGPTVGDFRDYPWDVYQKEVQKKSSDFNTPKIRKAIEDRVAPIPTANLIMYESVDRVYPIIPGTLEVTFRSLTAQEDMMIKDKMFEVQGSDRYVLDTLILMTLTCGLKVFNGATLPDHMKTDDVGNLVVDEDRLKVKMGVIQRLSLQVVSLLSVVYGWFDEHIRSQMVDEILKKS